MKKQLTTKSILQLGIRFFGVGVVALMLNACGDVASTDADLNIAHADEEEGYRNSALFNLIKKSTARTKYDLGDSEYTCSATLIGRQTFLSAAHCFPEYGSANIRVKLGGYTFNTSTRYVRSHRSYDHDNNRSSYDIAVFTVGQDLTRYGFQPVPIASAGLFLPEGTTVYQAGFGGAQEDGRGLGVLRMKKATTDLSLRDNLWHKFHSKGRTCGGDSGGPTFFLRGNKLTVLAALHGGRGKCEDTDKSYGTDVREFNSWIQKNTSENIAISTQQFETAAQSQKRLKSYKHKVCGKMYKKALGGKYAGEFEADIEIKGKPLVNQGPEGTYRYSVFGQNHYNQQQIRNTPEGSEICVLANEIEDNYGKLPPDRADDMFIDPEWSHIDETFIVSKAGTDPVTDPDPIVNPDPDPIVNPDPQVRLPTFVARLQEGRGEWVCAPGTRGNVSGSSYYSGELKVVDGELRFYSSAYRSGSYDDVEIDPALAQALKAEGVSYFIIGSRYQNDGSRGGYYTYTRKVTCFFR